MLTRHLATAMVLAGWPWAQSVAQTNQFYLTDETNAHYGDTITFSAEQIERAKSAMDSRPAASDPEGHWGTAAEGFQLSICLNRQTFTNGEDVVACVILRNVSEKLLRYDTTLAGRDPMSKLTLTLGGQRIPDRYEPKPGMTFNEKLNLLYRGSLASFPSPVGTQRKFLVQMNKLFDLSANGQYVVRARRTVPKLDTSGQAEVVSGEATFRIVPALAPTEK